MLTIRNTLWNLVAAAALASLAASAFAVETADQSEAIKLKSLAQLEERATTSADFERLARLCEIRAAMLDEKAVRHQRLEKRYAAALLAKRGTAWNTPQRQRRLAQAARQQAAESRAMASGYLCQGWLSVNCRRLVLAPSQRPRRASRRDPRSLIATGLGHSFAGWVWLPAHCPECRATSSLRRCRGGDRDPRCRSGCPVGREPVSPIALA